MRANPLVQPTRVKPRAADQVRLDRQSAIDSDRKPITVKALGIRKRSAL